MSTPRDILPDERTMMCRRCGSLLDAQPELVLGRRAARYEDLVFRCERCGVGYSNATWEDARIEIAATPAGNVPPEVREGVDDALAAAVNLDARPGKAWKFCSANSEDAVTWTVIRALEQTGQLDRVAAAVGLADAIEASVPPRLLLWGAAARPSDPDAVAAEALLTEVSIDLREALERRSEPDVIVLWDDAVVVIEAKYKAANDREKTGLRRFDRYLQRPDQWTATKDAVKAEGLYELVRNWVIACELAERSGATHAVLANLAPAALAADITAFRALAATSPTRRIEHIRWRSLFADPAPAWLARYASDLGLLTL
jgi:hypothetical protein